MYCTGAYIGHIRALCDRGHYSPLTGEGIATRAYYAIHGRMVITGVKPDVNNKGIAGDRIPGVLRALDM